MTDVPDPTVRYPLGDELSVVFLNTILNNPKSEIGDVTHCLDFDDRLGFEKNVRYPFPFDSDRLIVGRFCAIVHGATFIMNGGNHGTDGLSAYPFGIFGGGWAAAMPESWPERGDLVIGQDVWIGHRATPLPGISVGHGAVIDAEGVVAADAAPYTIVAGNPAQPIRRRHPPATIDRLLELAWCDRPIDQLTCHVQLIAGGDIDASAAMAPPDP